MSRMWGSPSHICRRRDSESTDSLLQTQPQTKHVYIYIEIRKKNLSHSSTTVTAYSVLHTGHTCICYVATVNHILFVCILVEMIKKNTASFLRLSHKFNTFHLQESCHHWDESIAIFFLLSVTHLLTTIPFLFSFGPKKALLAQPRRETIREDDDGVGVRRIAGCLDTVVLPVCSAAPPKSQTRGCWGFVLTSRRSLYRTLPKPTARYPCREQSGIIWFGVSLISFCSHSRARASPHYHICSWRGEEHFDNSCNSSSFLQKSRFQVLCTDYKSLICEHEWKE